MIRWYILFNERKISNGVAVNLNETLMNKMIRKSSKSQYADWVIQPFLYPSLSDMMKEWGRAGRLTSSPGCPCTPSSSCDSPELKSKTDREEHGQHLSQLFGEQYIEFTFFFASIDTKHLFS